MSTHFVNPLDLGKTVCDQPRRKKGWTSSSHAVVRSPDYRPDAPWEPDVDYDRQPELRKTVTCTNCLRGVAFLYAGLRGQVKRAPVPLEELLETCVGCKKKFKELPSGVSDSDEPWCPACLEAPPPDNVLKFPGT